MYTPRSCTNTWYYSGVMSIACPAKHMCEVKYQEFCHGVVYKANEGCHIRIFIYQWLA